MAQNFELLNKLISELKTCGVTMNLKNDTSALLKFPNNNEILLDSCSVARYTECEKR